MRVKWPITLLLLLLFTSEAMAEVVVIMRREAQTAGKYVRICDVARVDGPKEQAREVAMTVLGPAPSRGEVREISRWDIESRLFEMGVAARVSFSGNPMVMVRGHGAPQRRFGDEANLQELMPVPGRSQLRDGDSMDLDVGSSAAPIAKPSPMVFERDRSDRQVNARELMSKEARARVGKEVANYFADRYRAAKSNRNDIEVDAKLISSSADIPYSAYEIKVEDADGRIPGKASLRLSVRDTDDSPAREVTVIADTDVYGQALVAARNISRGESLDKNDVTTARVKMESGQSYLPPNPKSIVGREAKRQFKVGEAILAAEAPMGDAVKRGDLVVMKKVGSGWDVQSRVKAHGSGGVGDIITVEDVTDKVKYPARIVGPGTVEVVVKHDSHGIVKK